MRVRPLAVSHLCFETDGVLADLNLNLNPNGQGSLLGTAVPAFDFNQFYEKLQSTTQRASGFIAFTTNPAANTAIVLNGTTWTFVNSLTTGNQLLIASTLAETLEAAVPVLQSSTDANTSGFLYSLSLTGGNIGIVVTHFPLLVLTALIGGPSGNSLTFSTTVSGAVVSGPTLAGGSASRQNYDSSEIWADVAPFALATLRAESRKAALNKAINMAENMYFAKYSNVNGPDGTIARINEYYSPSSAGSKSARLDNLSNLAQKQADLLGNAYETDGRPVVVTQTTSVLKSDTTTYGYSATSEEDFSSGIGGIEGSGPDVKVQVQVPPQQPGPLPAPAWPPPFPQPPERAGDTAGWDPSISRGDNLTENFQISNSYQTISNNAAAHQEQHIYNTGYGYRIPSLESQAQNERAQISLIDQKFAAFMYAQNLPNLAKVFPNEWNSIVDDVYRLQIAYLNTILISPISGIVTGVYKNTGEAVRAGEPVIRVENYNTVLLEASLIFRGLISIDQTVTVTTALFDASSTGPISIIGIVVAARGHGNDDQWNVIVECNNLVSLKPIFPPGYRFDYDNTTVTIG
jgi:biotin carboxyl carrier protein